MPRPLVSDELWELIEPFPGDRIDPWRPWWLRVLLKLRVSRAKRIDERRHAAFVEASGFLADE